MPGGDKTGPGGTGPMTGKKMGYCSGNDFEGSQPAGRGMGWRRGAGRGFGLRFRGGVKENTIRNASANPLLDEIKSLKERLNFLEKNQGS